MSLDHVSEMSSSLEGTIRYLKMSLENSYILFVFHTIIMSWNVCNSFQQTNNHFVSYSAFHLSKWPCRNTEKCKLFIFSPLLLCTHLSFRHTQQDFTEPSVIGTDSCVGEEKACLSSECGFSSPCHLKAFQLHVHIILNSIINFQEKETSDESEYKTSFWHCNLKKAIQWLLNLQEGIALICVNTGLKGWIFFPNLSPSASLFLPPLSPSGSRTSSFDFQRKYYRWFENLSSHQEKIWNRKRLLS